jgi:hypothetical protein
LRSTTLIICLSLIAGCQGYELDRRDYKDYGVAWGEAVGGVKAGVARREYQSGYAPGPNQAYLSLRLLNVTRQPIRILAPTPERGTITIPEDLAGDESVAVRMAYETPDGVKVGEFKPDKKPAVTILEPGREWAMELRIAPEKFGLRQFVPGRMTVSYVNRQETIRYKASGDEPASGLWTGEAKSGAVTIDPPAATTQPAKMSAGGGRGGDGR